MTHYTYTDHSLGGPVLKPPNRLGKCPPLVHIGLALGRPSFGQPFPAHKGMVVFECDASNILEADALLLAKTGIVAAKSAEIGCALS